MNTFLDILPGDIVIMEIENHHEENIITGVNNSLPGSVIFRGKPDFAVLRDALSLAWMYISIPGSSGLWFMADHGLKEIYDYLS